MVGRSNLIIRIRTDKNFFGLVNFIFAPTFFGPPTNKGGGDQEFSYSKKYMVNYLLHTTLHLSVFFEAIGITFKCTYLRINASKPIYLHNMKFCQNSESVFRSSILDLEVRTQIEHTYYECLQNHS